MIDAPVADCSYALGGMSLSLGGELKKAELAYVTLGKLNARGDNAVLVLHGYTSSHRFVLPDDPDSAEGSWASLIGPGRAIDTQRYFVVAPNFLGSSHGSTGPASVNPETDKPYGPDFPALQFEDIVQSQHRLLKHLGVTRLHAVVGLSMGGFCGFQWAIQYPAFVRQLVVVLSGPWGGINATASQNSVTHVLQSDPNWNGGWVYQNPGSMFATLKKIRIATLTRYGVAQWLADQHNNPQTASAALEAMASHWARHFDPNAMVVLREAINRFDARPQLNQIQADVLYVLASTDRLFPPAIAQETLNALSGSARRVEHLVIDSDYGHYASSLDWARWSDALSTFINHPSA